MNEKLQERLPEIIKAVRYVRSLVARASIECRPERYTEDREEWEEYNKIKTGACYFGSSYTYLDMYDWLLAHHFDYRGLIEKGLAIEAPEDMY